jgi:hypothetical protein
MAHKALMKPTMDRDMKTSENRADKWLIQKRFWPYGRSTCLMNHGIMVGMKHEAPSLKPPNDKAYGMEGAA